MNKTPGRHLESNVVRVETISLALWWGKILHWSPRLIVFGMLAVIFLWSSFSILASYFYFDFCAERNVRGMALVLELVGFYFLLRSHLEVRRAFGMRGVTSQIVSYFQSFPRRTIHHVSVTGSAHGSVTVFGSGRASVWPAPDAGV